jgi:acetyl-CoA carboxylase carboxyl transferase subunit beta
LLELMKPFATIAPPDIPVPSSLYSTAVSAPALVQLPPRVIPPFTSLHSQSEVLIVIADNAEGTATPSNPLDFKGPKTYTEKLMQDQGITGLKEAAVTGEGLLDSKKAIIAVTDSRFIMGSMGSVVGEKIARAVESATKNGLPVVIVSGSGGGARMYEGMFSLMQMAKTSAVLSYHHKKKLPFISVLTNPTMAGVMASFAGLGDIILAEPKALIGFTGPRVIEQTIRQKLPVGFQRSEFLLEHGLIDLIVHRKNLKETLRQLLDYLS